MKPELSALLEQLDRREIRADLRHSFLTLGDDAFVALFKIVEESDGSPQIVSNALHTLKEFCLWVSFEKRNAVFELALAACQNQERKIREAGTIVVIGLCRTYAESPDASSISPKLRSVATQSLRAAIEAGMDKEKMDYSKWYLEQFNN